MKSIKYFLLFLLISMLFVGAAPKDDKLKDEYFINAFYFYGIEDWEEALYNFLKLGELRPNNASIEFFTGICYLNIPEKEYLAIPHLVRASKKVSQNATDDINETKAPLEAIFFLGSAYRYNNQLDEALLMYNKYIKIPFVQKNRNLNLIEQEIKACERAKVIRDKPIDVKYTLLDSSINNSSANYKPVISNDENLIIFMNSLKFYNAIYMSRKINEKWGEPENISPQLGSDGDAEPSCISFDGQQLYIVRKSRNQSDIYVSNWLGNRWSNMVALNKKINTTKNETHVSISADGQTLYFSSNRKGGEGGLDLYKSVKGSDGDWGEAINLGKKINTPFNENMPSISENGEILFFCSEGHLNMGGYDFFYSRKLDPNNWESPINMGFPINTTSDDLNLYLIKNGTIGITSLTKTTGYGSKDIYLVENKTFLSDSTLVK